MNRKLAIAVTIGFALATSACSHMGGGSGDETSFWGGNSPVGDDPAGSATFGTGSSGFSGADSRVDYSTGTGLDSN